VKRNVPRPCNRDGNKVAPKAGPALGGPQTILPVPLLRQSNREIPPSLTLNLAEKILVDWRDASVAEDEKIHIVEEHEKRTASRR
jgi:hypothetical protein